MEEPVAAARVLVGELFPAARWAVLGGSVLTDARTAGSDLDIVVCLPENPALPHRRSLRWNGWPVELFVHDTVTLEHYLAKGRDERRPSLHRMLATGVTVAGHDRDAAGVRATCAATLADGPPALGEVEMARMRYLLTDLLDDLAHSRDPAETVAITAALWSWAAELALQARRQWVGGGKWLLRELRDLDERLAGRWVTAHGDPLAVAALAGEVLGWVGGPLFDG
jgi:hypothetical protein